MRVLIVDDEEDVHEMLRELPELEGFEVYTARDAQDALSKVAVEPPCAVVLDLMMPVMDDFRGVPSPQGRPEAPSVTDLRCDVRPVAGAETRRWSLSQSMAFACYRSFAQPAPPQDEQPQLV